MRRRTHGEAIRGLLGSDVKPVILGLLFMSVPHHTPLPHLPFHLVCSVYRFLFNLFLQPIVFAMPFFFGCTCHICTRTVSSPNGVLLKPLVQGYFLGETETESTCRKK